MDYKEFILRFRLFASKRPDLVLNTLSNIFTMRLIGNKTHGDLAEVGISEFINQYFYDLGCVHVGKQFYRSKLQEEDIVVIDKLNVKNSPDATEDVSTFCLLNLPPDKLDQKLETIARLQRERVAVPISLKAYGDGPLQLSTDRDSTLFECLNENLGLSSASDPETVGTVLNSEAFRGLSVINVMSLIYDEKNKRCRIIVFDMEKAFRETAKIEYSEAGHGRRHPVYKFLNSAGEYILEVRYGGKAANALQRGMWTNTRNAPGYFILVTGGEDGWVSYEYNTELVKLIALALNASRRGHNQSNGILQDDINGLFDGNA